MTSIPKNVSEYLSGSVPPIYVFSVGECIKINLVAIALISLAGYVSGNLNVAYVVVYYSYFFVMNSMLWVIGLLVFLLIYIVGDNRK